MAEGSGAERRRHSRKEFPAQASIIVDGRDIQGMTTNVSVSGALIAAEIQLNPNAGESSVLAKDKKISVSIPKIGVSATPARVIRVSESSRGALVAIEFEKLNTQIPTRIIDSMLRSR